MKILLTGANGFIGRNIKLAIQESCEVIECTKDSEHNINDVDSLLDINDIDVVIHAAAQTGVSNSYKNPYEYYQFNINSSLNISEFCRIKKIKKLIYLNTYFYGQHPTNPINENHPINPHSPYSSSKYISEKLLLNYPDNDTCIISLRIFNLFGLHQPIDFFIPSLIYQILNGQKAMINDIRPKRDYLYIKDLVKLVSIIIFDKTKISSDIFNVGSGRSHGLSDIIKILEKYLKINISYNNNNIIRPNEILDCYADTSKIKQSFDWNCKYSFEEGLIDYLKNIQIPL
jgi:nucleoside-diphosphate-sugar epimerase